MRIIKNENEVYTFNYNENEEKGYSVIVENCGRECLRCEICNELVECGYCYIIRTLSKHNLLPQNHKIICCFCDVLQKYGLIDLRENLYKISYSGSLYYPNGFDFISIIFKFYKDENIYYPEYYEVRIWK